MLFISKAYRTTSTAALSVITSLPPIDLIVEKEVKYHRLARIDKTAEIRGTVFDPS